MIEVELKAKLDAREAVERCLAALGFVPGEAVYERDVYYNGNDRDFWKTDEALRVREQRARGCTTCLLTYKGPKLDAATSTRTEHETAAADPESLRAILAGLGYRAAFTVEKTRRCYKKGANSALIDDVTGLGCYLELERVIDDGADRAAATEELLRLLVSLGVPETALTRRSYLEQLFLRRQAAERS